MFAHALHHFDHFLVCLAQPQHQARLGRNVRHHLLETLQQGQRPLVIGARTRSLVQARHSFEVVVEYVRRLGCGDFKRNIHAPTVVRNKCFEQHARRQFADFANAVGKVLGTTVTQVIAVYRGDHHVLQAQISDGNRQAFRLIGVQWLRSAVAHVTERATTGADVTHDHEGRGTAREAFAQVRAGGFFAHAVQLVLTQQGLDTVDFRRNRNAYANPVRLLRQFGGRNDLYRDTRNLLGTAQLDAGLNLGTGLAGAGRTF